jgi:hypothetical protein
MYNTCMYVCLYMYMLGMRMYVGRRDIHVIT